MRFNWALIPAIMGVWLIIGLISAGQYSIAAWSAGQETRWWDLVLREVPAWQVWSLLTPLAIVVARRFPLARDRLLAHAPLHLLAAVACGIVYIVAWMGWSGVITPALVTEHPLTERFFAFFRARFNVAFLVYWAVIGVYYAVRNYRELQARELAASRAQTESARAREEAARARAELARSRLEALRQQLHPHFLFNTLHSIASLMDEDVPTARRLIARLSDLLRTVLESSEEPEVPLARELEFLENYLEIERVRYGERLRVRFDIQEETKTALVPPILLQPIVENAVRHGIEPLEEGGTVVVRSRGRNGRLYLEVHDTGRGQGGEGSTGHGLGLKNTAERLEQLYGTDHSFEMRATSDRGARVAIEIPYRAAGAGARSTERGGWG